MRLKNALVPTLREVPKEAEIKSHIFMMRAGLIRQQASGIYSYMPMGLKVMKNVENIIRQEMDRQGALEILMPAILPAEPYIESGRWEVFGPEMFKLKDRNDRDFCLGPTHEELFTLMVKNEVKSYKQLPLTIYQIQTKYRDERRPRFGVMRCREFVMKDAYSFDVDNKGLDESYNKMYQAYKNSFDRMKLDYVVVDADSGAMGGSGSQEFTVVSDIGESVIAYCKECGYSANDEKAECVTQPLSIDVELKEMEMVETPNIRTIDDLVGFFNTDEKSFAKTLIYKADEEVIAVILRGDREINETKLQNYLGANELEMANPDDVYEATKAQVGFAGPVGLEIRVLADNEVANMRNFIIGANKTNHHFVNANVKRDFNVEAFADLRNIVKGDKCPVCEHEIETARGIEVGHVFKLGTKYSKALDCKFLDENGKEQTMIMGCYGIGVGRTLAAIIEQNCDDDGIIWPVSVAPYKVAIVPVKSNDETQMELADKLYKEFVSRGIDTVIDDRNERVGVKFKDADLIGYPIRITVGKKADDGIVEYRTRKEKEVIEMNFEQAVKATLDYISDNI